MLKSLVVVVFIC